MKYILDISKILKNLEKEEEIYNFLLEILTESELATLSKRWQILLLLKEGKTQRKIAEEMNVGLCKVTRGAKLLKNKSSIIGKIIRGENDD